MNGLVEAYKRTRLKHFEAFKNEKETVEVNIDDLNAMLMLAQIKLSELDKEECNGKS